jgi:O-antigen/teichoic acid export membrane protein
MGFKKTFFKNVAVFGGYSYLSWIFDTLISTIILSRFLGPKEYGFVALINIFSGFILLFSNTGLSFAVIRSDYGPKYQKIVFSLGIWIGIILCIVLSLLAYPITLIYNKPDLFWPTIVVSTQFISYSLNIVPMAILQKKFEFKYVGLVNFVTVLFTITAMIIMAALGCSYWSLIVPIFVQPLFRHIFWEYKTKFGFHLYGWKLTKFGYLKVRSLLESISIFNLINYFARNADNFAVGKFYGEVSIGLYDRAYKFIYMSIRLINTVMGPVLFPCLKEAKSKGEDYRSHFLDILGMINLLNLAIAIPLVLFAKPITLILWGKNWIGVADFLPYIGAMIPMQTMLIAAMDLYMLDNKEKAYLTLGIPLSLILVVGIVIGAFFSPLYILRCYALSFILVQIPVSLYFGHYRILKFTARQIFQFWVPKIIITALLIFSIWFGNMLTTFVIMVIYTFETVYFRYNDIKEVFFSIKDRLMKGRNDFK